jgi:hypothetical protein
MFESIQANWYFKVSGGLLSNISIILDKSWDIS